MRINWIVGVMEKAGMRKEDLRAENILEECRKRDLAE